MSYTRTCMIISAFPFLSSIVVFFNEKTCEKSAKFFFLSTFFGKSERDKRYGLKKQ